MSVLPVQVTAVGAHVPEKRLTNADLEKMVDTSDDWIVTRTGIRERRLVAPGEATSDLAAQAARRTLAARGVGPETVDLLVLATITPDYLVPSTACLTIEKLGAKNAWGWDLNAACSGFLFALVAGAQFVATGRHKRVLVVGADVMSAITDFTDRQTCVLFGDAAGAFLLEPAADAGSGLLDYVVGSDGKGADLLSIPAGGSARPTTHETVEARQHFLRQTGRQVYRLAVEGMVNVTRSILERNRLGIDDVALYVPHQANQRIIDSMIERLKVPPGRVVVNIDRYGNTTAATLPLAMADALEAKRVKKGDRVVFTTFGAGFTWGSALVRWTY